MVFESEAKIWRKIMFEHNNKNPKLYEKVNWGKNFTKFFD